MSRPKLMTVDEAMAAVSGNHPIVIETRKYGVVADWYSARNKNEFSEWMRRRILEGAYPRIEYNRTWRAWENGTPSDEQRRATEWR